MRRRSAIWTLIRMFAFSIWVYGGSIFMPHKKLLVYSCHPPRPPIKPLQLWTILEPEYGSRPIIDFCIGNWSNIIALHAGKVHHTHCMNKAPLKYLTHSKSKSKYILLPDLSKKPRRFSWKKRLILIWQSFTWNSLITWISLILFQISWFLFSADLAPMGWWGDLRVYMS